MEDRLHSSICRLAHLRKSAYIPLRAAIKPILLGPLSLDMGMGQSIGIEVVGYSTLKQGTVYP